MKYLTISLFVLLFSCKPSEKAATNEKPTVKEAVIDFTIIKEGTNSGFTEFKESLITKQADLSETWNNIFANYMQKDPLPKIDFKTNEVYLIAMGEKTSGGYTIKVESVVESKKEIIINVVKSIPGKSCMTTSVMTYPYQLIMFQKKDKPVRFNGIDKVYECGKE